MALGGSLDDVSVVDVLQFINMSGRTGALVVRTSAGVATVEFSAGNIVFARSPASRPLGALLVDAGLLSPEELERLVALQGAASDRLPLGRLVIDAGRSTAEALAAVVRQQIQEAVFELVTWTTGQFQFQQGSGEAPDDVRVDVEELLPLVGMNTQFFLLEALRLVDERRREGSLPPPAPAPQATLDLPEPTIRPPTAELTPAPNGPQSTIRRPAPSSRPSVLTVGFDTGLVGVVRESTRELGARWMGHLPTRDVEAMLLGTRSWPSTLVLAWRLHGPDSERERLLGLLSEVRKRHPHWTTVLLVSGGSDAVTAAYESGAQAVLPIAATAGVVDRPLASALRTVLQRCCVEMSRQETAEAREIHAWVEARRMTMGLTKAMQHATVSLELMRVAAAVLDRAVLLLAKRRELVGLGAFGLTRDGQSMGDAMRGLSLPITDGSPVARALQEGRAIVGPPRSLGLGPAFFNVAGEPAAPRGVLVPLVGPSRTIGLLYGDNGSLAEPIRGVHAVELAAAHAGLAFENALLRLRLERSIPTG